MTTPNNIHQLYERFLLGLCNAEEIRLLVAMFGAEEEHNLEEIVRRALEKNNATDITDKDYSPRYDRILANIRQEISQKKQPKKKNTLKLAMAACSSMIICFFGYYYWVKNDHNSSAHKNVYVKADIKPGGDKAYLTLSDGRKILLSDALTGTIAKDAGGIIQKTADGQIKYDNGYAAQSYAAAAFNSLETPKGGQFKVVLPDGTHVWMNAASSLKYPASFANLKERKIQLRGEAYFEVFKDATRPFIVQTDDQTIQVLGTHFNVNAYHDGGGSKTTLLEGSIKAISKKMISNISPGQQVVTEIDGGLSVKRADSEVAVAWKNDQFMFDNEPLAQLMKRLSRWYDVDVVYSTTVPDIRFNGAISKFSDISAVLRILESTGKVHFKISSRTIYVEPATHRNS